MTLEIEDRTIACSLTIGYWILEIAHYMKHPGVLVPAIEAPPPQQQRACVRGPGQVSVLKDKNENR